MPNILRFLAVIATALVLAGFLAGQASTSVGKLSIDELQKLADGGDAGAQNELGVRYTLGRDVEKDPAKAIPWFLKSAKQGYAKAYFNLGVAYYNGTGVPVNDQNYCAWFIFSADAGDERGVEAVARTRQELGPSLMARCEVLAASSYLTGNIIKQDYANARKWYLESANAGDGAACERLAYMYNRGLGVAVDQQESLKWLQRAAHVNYPLGIFEIGSAYEAGVVIPGDLKKAREFYERASFLGFPPAFTALGNLYANGRGVKLDRQEALAYYLVAASNGDPTAKQKVDELTTQLSAKQVESAKLEARSLIAKIKGPVILVRK